MVDSPQRTITYQYRSSFELEIWFRLSPPQFHDNARTTFEELYNSHRAADDLSDDTIRGIDWETCTSLRRNNHVRHGADEHLGHCEPLIH